MNKDLPRVYANPIDKELNNNTEVFYSENRSLGSVSNIDIVRKINNIFASPRHVYKSHVLITTFDGTIDTVIVGKINNSLLTLNGDKININEIRDISRI